MQKFASFNAMVSTTPYVTQSRPHPPPPLSLHSGSGIRWPLLYCCIHARCDIQAAEKQAKEEAKQKAAAEKKEKQDAEAAAAFAAANEGLDP